MLKRLTSVLVLTVFLAHFAGFYIYFFTQLNLVRMEMRAKLKELPPEKLELITLSGEAYKEARVEEHEIKVEGKMYDIARIEERGDFVLIHCLHDAAEDNLLAFLDKILGLPLKDNEVPTGVIQFLSLNYLPTHWSFTFSEMPPLNSFTRYVETSSQFTSAEITPPPKG